MLFYEPKFPKYEDIAPAPWDGEYFQCSSTSRNSQNSSRGMSSRETGSTFSALLRAEIPKMWPYVAVFEGSYVFQCSSTSRNSQNPPAQRQGLHAERLSVLFYEPKFPKSSHRRRRAHCGHPFSALLRAEIPKIRIITALPSNAQTLSVLFYEPKFPKS